MTAADKSVSSQLRHRIEELNRKEPAAVFVPADFLDLGSPHAIGMELSRLVRSGKLRRIARGMYDVPRTHPVLGELRPNPEQIALALARRDGVRIQPAEAMAANLLSLSEQVPARAVYETDGRARKVTVGATTIEFKRRSPKQVRNASPMSNLVFGALRSVGKANVDEARIEHLRRSLSPVDRVQLLEDLPLAPAWMHPHIRFIASNRPTNPSSSRQKKRT